MHTCWQPTHFDSLLDSNLANNMIHIANPHPSQHDPKRAARRMVLYHIWRTADVQERATGRSYDAYLDFVNHVLCCHVCD